MSPRYLMALRTWRFIQNVWFSRGFSPPMCGSFKAIYYSGVFFVRMVDLPFMRTPLESQYPCESIEVCQVLIYVYLCHVFPSISLEDFCGEIELIGRDTTFEFMASMVFSMVRITLGWSSTCLIGGFFWDVEFWDHYSGACDVFWLFA